MLVLQFGYCKDLKGGEEAGQQNLICSVPSGPSVNPVDLASG